MNSPLWLLCTLCSCVNITEWHVNWVKLIQGKLFYEYVQLNEYETDPYFLPVIQQFVRFFTCFVSLANASVNLKLFWFDFSNQKQFHVRKSYKTRKSTFSCIENFEENIDLSNIFNIKSYIRDHPYITLVKGLGGWGTISTIYTDVGWLGGSKKSKKVLTYYRDGP